MFGNLGRKKTAHFQVFFKVFW